LRNFLAAGHTSAAAERKAVAAAGAWFDKRVGPVAGTANHVARAVERATGKKWSIDSWIVGYGQTLEVMPLERWKDLD
jgi:hypothetical protein